MSVKDIDAPVRKDQPTKGHKLALHPAWIVVAASCALLIRGTLHLGLNTDVFWAVAAGNWMLAHHSIIRTDVFSYTVPGHPWFAEEWGFEFLLAWMVRHIGSVSYWLVSGGMCTLALLASATRWRRQGASNLWMAALSIPTTAALFVGLAPRPQDMSYLLFALLLLILTLARRRRGWLISLPPLFLLWCNVHGSFLLGLVVLALEVVVALGVKVTFRLSARQSSGERSADRQSFLRVSQSLRVSDAATCLIASALATLINPHGFGLWSYAFKVTTSSYLGFIEEWMSPNFQVFTVFLAIAVPTLIVVVILASGRAQTELLDLIVWGGLLVATLHAVRFAPYLGMAFAGLAAPWDVARRETIRPTLLTFPAAAILCVALLAGGYLRPGTSQPGEVPISAATWLQHRSGRVFSTYGWNDYLIARGIPVFIDGRTDLYFGTGIIPAYISISELSVPPDPILRHWRVQWVLWPTRDALSNYLAVDPNWRLVHAFHTGEIFERVGIH